MLREGKMTVTVVMSTYNGEKYLREQIESILRQEEIETVLFVRDDGSSDGTLDILREYAAKYQNVSFSAGDNLGVGRSFQEALRTAPRSTYYAFADQDDIWLPRKLIAGINVLDSSKCNGIETPLLYTCRTIPADNELRPLKEEKNYIGITFGSSLLENHASGCTFVFNSRAAELFLRFPHEQICIHDWDLLRIVLAAGGKVFQDENGYVLYRQHGSNAVGADVSKKHRAGKMLRGDPLQKLRGRLVFADHLRKTYADVIPEDNLRILDSLCDYNKSFSSRMALIRSGEIARTDRTDDMIFKILFLFGLL